MGIGKSGAFVAAVFAFGMVLAAGFAADSAKGKQLRIGVIYLTAEHPFYQAFARNMQNYSKEKGIDLIEIDGKLDQANMATQMENLIARKVDGIVYCLLEPTPASVDINEAQAAGIPVISYAIKHDTNAASCPFVGLDEFAAGRLGGVVAGEYFKAKFAGKEAKVALVEMPGQAAVVDRSNGFFEGFQSVVPSAAIVARLDGAGVKDKSMSVTEDILQSHPEINVFFGANGDMGLGALAALEASGRGGAKTELVVSHDGSEPEVMKIAEPNSALKIANANRPGALAVACIDTIVDMANGKRDMKNTDDIFVSSMVLTADNLDEAQTLLRDEYFSDLVIKTGK